MALLNEINVKGVPHPIVTDDGYYEEMTVGDAEQLISTQFVEDNKPYLFRPTGGSSDVGNRAYLDKIIGGTVAWNQLVDKNSIPSTRTENGLTFTNNGDGSVTVNGTAESMTHFSFNANITYVAGHKYLLLGCPSGGSTSTYRMRAVGGHLDDYGNGSINTAIEVWNTIPLILITVFSGAVVSNLVFKSQMFDITQMFGSTIADYIYSLEQSQAGAGVAWFKKLFPKDYYEYNAGELLSVEGLQSHDTVGFNAFDIATNKAKLLGGYQYEIVGAYTSVSYEDASGNVETLTITNRLFTPTNNGILTVVGADSTTCVHLVWSGYRNGEYEPYKKHSYTLDSSLTLRGIPKLDASNNLYYDGDEYESDGTVTRKYGIVTFDGSNDEDWSRLGSSSASAYAMKIKIDGKIIQTSNRTTIICDKLMPVSPLDTWGNYSQFIAPVLGSNMIVAGISTITTIKDWRTYLASNPITVLFELATPTTETAEPFHNIQIVDDFGTEEFVSTGIVPVGHKTRYTANLRDKLQHLPDLAGMDGTYLIRQTGKQMSLVHIPTVFPDTPTEDGTYTLKATVSGGTPTYVWEGVNAESEGE